MKKIILLLFIFLTSCQEESIPEASVLPQSHSMQKFQTYTVQEDPTINPMRGLYQWRGDEIAPQNKPAQDSYQRYYWKDFEKTEGVYDFSSIVKDMNSAIAEGRKFAFRIRMMGGYDDNVMYMPSWLYKHASCTSGCGWWLDVNPDNDSNPDNDTKTFIPDWNDQFVITKAQNMLKALSGQLKSISWIDVGMYGQYGEWALSSKVNYAKAPSGIVAITDDTKKKYVDMHVTAFTSQRLVMLIVRDNFEAIKYAREISKNTLPVGLRVDCLGQIDFFDQWTNRPEEWNQIKGFWKDAPFIAEFCPFETSSATRGFAVGIQQLFDHHISYVGNGNVGKPNQSASERWQGLSTTDKEQFLKLAKLTGYRYALTQLEASTNAGTLTIKSNWKNEGNTPLHEPYEVRYELMRNGNVIATMVSNIKLNTLTDVSVGEKEYTEIFTPSVPTGTYELVVSIINKPGNPNYLVRKPLQLINKTMNANGIMVVGTVTF